MTKKQLNNIKQELEESMNDLSLDFVSDYDIESDHYLSDLFSEYADGAISVYYSDQWNYYTEHSEECENALLELYDGESIANLIKSEGLNNLCCKAAVCGMYSKNYQELSDDEENIKKLLVVRYLLKNDIFTLSAEQLSDLLDEAGSYRIDKTGELLDLVKEYTEKEE